MLIMYYILMGLICGVWLEPHMRRHQCWDMGAFAICLILWPLLLAMGIYIFVKFVKLRMLINKLGSELKPPSTGD